MRTLRSGQSWDYAVREATRAVDTADKNRLGKPCLDFVVAFEGALEANADPVFPALKAMAAPLADEDPCSAGTLQMLDLIENKGLDVTAALRDDLLDGTNAQT